MGWLDAAIIATFLAAAIRMATPLILSAIGEIFAERSGVLNLAVEGHAGHNSQFDSAFVDDG